MHVRDAVEVETWQLMGVRVREESWMVPWSVTNLTTELMVGALKRKRGLQKRARFGRKEERALLDRLGWMSSSHQGPGRTSGYDCLATVNDLRKIVGMQRGDTGL